ncbi:MAG: nuclear transport factor 2 family protein [Candidatus Promineifilaceae bacterium]
MKLSRIEQGIRSVLAYYEAFNQQDVPSMLARFSEACLLEAAGPRPDGDVFIGKTAVAAYWQEFFETHDDAHIDVEDIFGLGNRCVARWQLTWLDNNRRRRTLRGADIFLIQGALLSEQRSYTKA